MSFVQSTSITSTQLNKTANPPSLQRLLVRIIIATFKFVGLLVDLDPYFPVPISSPIQIYAFPHFSYSQKRFFDFYFFLLGVFEVGFKNEKTGNHFGMILMVMENLTFERNATGSYDLKGLSALLLLCSTASNLVLSSYATSSLGSLRNRMVDEENVQGSYGPYSLVLMDENLLNTARDNPFYITPEVKTILTEAIQNDTSFLEDNSMMDYSLFVAIDGDKLVLG